MNTLDYDIDQPAARRTHEPATLLRGTAVFVTFNLQDHVPIPNSLLRAMEDFHAGKVVDMDTALNEQPPNNQE